MSFHHELQVAQRLALEAAAVILEVYKTSFEVVEKTAGQGPVTEADTRANEIIVAGLRKAFPSDDIIAEESINHAPSRQRVWFVDPLDGTREFVDRNGMFAIHIGLAVDGVASAGVVHAPVQGATWLGAKGHPCELVMGTQRRTLTMAPPAPGLRLVVSRSHRSKKTERIRAELGITEIREQGSVGLKCGLLAMSEVDLYLHPSPRSSRWDSCAPQAVLEAAGGQLTDFAGAPYRYDGLELGNLRGLVGCHPETWARIAPVVSRIAAETKILAP